MLGTKQTLPFHSLDFLVKCSHWMYVQEETRQEQLFLIRMSHIMKICPGNLYRSPIIDSIIFPSESPLNMFPSWALTHPLVTESALNKLGFPQSTPSTRAITSLSTWHGHSGAMPSHTAGTGPSKKKRGFWSPSFHIKTFPCDTPWTRGRLRRKEGIPIARFVSEVSPMVSTETCDGTRLSSVTYQNSSGAHPISEPLLKHSSFTRDSQVSFSTPSCINLVWRMWRWRFCTVF